MRRFAIRRRASAQAMLALGGALALGAGCIGASFTESGTGGTTTGSATGTTTSSGTPCVDGGETCDGGCVDVRNDPFNCGACSNACEDSQLCVDGNCMCRPFLKMCGSVCADPETDPTNCGGCGTHCAKCSLGVCVPKCPNGVTDCTGACVEDFQSNPLHCGNCTTVCASDQVCAGGACQQYMRSSSCTSCPCSACGNDKCCPIGTVTLCVTGDTCPPPATL